MKMNRILLAVLLAAAALPASAATLYVGHGIDGRDLGQPKALPVAICLVNGPLAITYPAELFSGVEFGQFAKIDADLPAGRYDVEVQLGSSGKCDGTVAIAGSVFLGFGESATAFAHLTEQGTPTLTKFTNDARPLGDGKTRVWARHAAAFSAVDVLLRSGHNKVFLRDLENPEQRGGNVTAGRYYVAIYPASRWGRPAFSTTLDLAAGKSYFLYAVGTPGNGTFTVLPQVLD